MPSLIENSIDLSVVIMTYSRSDLLAESIDSLRGALDSTRDSYEQIIADACTDSEHAERIESIPRARILRPARNVGLGANKNNGIAPCSAQSILQQQDEWKWIGESVLGPALRKFAVHINNLAARLKAKMTLAEYMLRVDAIEHFGVFSKTSQCCTAERPWITEFAAP